MSHPTKLGHVHLKVRELDRAVEFYTEVLGLEVTEQVGDSFVFLSFGEHHHDVALQALGPNAPGPSRGVGLYHSAFEVPDEDALRETYRRLEERGVEVSPVDHKISEALYFEDPDGNGVEVYLDTRERNDRWEWRGQNERLESDKL